MESTKRSVSEELGEPIGFFSGTMNKREAIEIIKSVLNDSKYDHFNVWSDKQGNFIIYGCELHKVKSYARLI